MLREEQSRGVELTVGQQGFLEDEDPDAWKRPDLPRRDATGAELGPGVADAPRASVYRKRLEELAVSKCPSYRRCGALHQTAQIPRAMGDATKGFARVVCPRPCQH